MAKRRGRPRKYDEKTIVTSFRVPESKKEQFRKKVNKILEKEKVQEPENEESKRMGETPHVFSFDDSRKFEARDGEERNYMAIYDDYQEVQKQAIQQTEAVEPKSEMFPTDMTDKEIYEEFGEYIDNDNENFKEFILKDEKRTTRKKK